MGIKRICVHFLFVVLVLFSISGCNSSSTTQKDENIITGSVVKGYIKDSIVNVYRIDTNQSLGKVATDELGIYSLNIGSYVGVVRVLARGGKYKDEITGIEQDFTNQTLEAISVVGEEYSYTVNITPLTQIAVNQLKSLDSNLSLLAINKNLVEDTNKKVAFAILDSEFDITKVTPKVLNKDSNYTISSEDGNSGEYGLFLANFAKLTDSNSTNVKTIINSFYEDIKEDGVMDVMDDKLSVALEDEVISGQITSELKDNIKIKLSRVYKTNAVIDGNNTAVEQGLLDTTEFIFIITQIDTSVLVSLNDTSNASFEISEDNGSTYINTIYASNNSMVKVTVINSANYDTTITTILKVGTSTLPINSKSIVDTSILAEIVVVLPTITLTTPAHNATDVNAIDDISIIFDKNVSIVAGKSFRIYTQDDEEHTNFDVNVSQVSGSGTNTITVNPNNHLVYGKIHYIQIDTGAFKDNNDNNFSGISDTTTWTFEVNATSGDCGCVDFDNCDLPTSLQ